MERDIGDGVGVCICIVAEYVKGLMPWMREI